MCFCTGDPSDDDTPQSPNPQNPEQKQKTRQEARAGSHIADRSSGGSRQLDEIHIPELDPLVAGDPIGVEDAGVRALDTRGDGTAREGTRIARERGVCGGGGGAREERREHG